MTRYSDHFTEEELADEHTGEIKLATGFLDALENLRTLYARPMVITDGCRSIETNAWLIQRGRPASPRSFHLMRNPAYATDGCAAVDVARPNGIDFHDLARLALTSKWSVRIGLIFIHLDRRVDYTDLTPHLGTY